MKATFDGDLEKLAFFMNQVWAHRDNHMADYLSDWAMVCTLTVNLESEAAAKFYDKDVPELGNIDTFLQKLRSRYEDDSQALQAEAKIYKIQQRGRLTKEYVQEF